MTNLDHLNDYRAHYRCWIKVRKALTKILQHPDSGIQWSSFIADSSITKAGLSIANARNILQNRIVPQ